MRLSTERLLLRKGVIDGVGKVVRAMYEQDSIEPLPESLAQLLARLNASRSLAWRKVGRSNTGRYAKLEGVGTSCTDSSCVLIDAIVHYLREARPRLG